MINYLKMKDLECLGPGIQASASGTLASGSLARGASRHSSCHPDKTRQRQPLSKRIREKAQSLYSR